MADPIKEASDSGWIARHRDLYLKDGEAGHMWDSAIAGGPGANTHPPPIYHRQKIGKRVDYATYLWRD